MLERQKNKQLQDVVRIRGLTLSAHASVDLDEFVRSLQRRYKSIKTLEGMGTSHQRLSIRTSEHKFKKLIRSLPHDVWAAHHDVNDQY